MRPFLKGIGMSILWIKVKTLIRIITLLIGISSLSEIASSRSFGARNDKPEVIAESNALTLPAAIRVAVIKGKKDLDLRIRGKYQIVTLHTYEPLLSGKNLQKVRFSAVSSGVKMGARELMIFGVKIITEGEAAVFLDDKRLRGEVDIIRNKDMTLTAVNYLFLDDYLYGVLPAEVSEKWPMESLKAQAIASRSYAAYQVIGNEDRDYDLTSSVYSQVYKGRDAEKKRARFAVDETRGEVLAFDGKLFPVFFHAACAGHTEDAKVLWELDFIPLRGVECYSCRRAPRFYWEAGLTFAEIEKKLSREGIKTGEIKDIKLSGRDRSNRIENVIVKGMLGDKVMPSNKFRLAMGADLIRSTNFRMEIKSGQAKFSGAGWGHGVGLCQWGAHFLGKEGYKAEEILKYYYPGSEIYEVRGLSHDLRASEAKP